MIIDSDEQYPTWIMNEATEYDETSKFRVGVIRDVPEEFVREYWRIQQEYDNMQHELKLWSSEQRTE